MDFKQAKQIPIEDYLLFLWFSPKIVQKNELWYFSPLRKEKTASFKVNKTLNVWYDHGEGIGGTIIDLVILQFQTDISGALKKLQSIFSTGFRQVLTKDKKEIEPKNKILIKEIKPLSYFPLINYLQERKINISIAKNYLVEIYYKAGSKDYFAIGFKNDSGWYEIRNNLFKGCFSPKDITTIKGTEGNREIYIFEWFIDFLSYLTYTKKQFLNEQIIILNSVCLTEKAIEKIKKINPSVLHFYLDNDKAGENTKNRILKETWLKGISKNCYYAGFKDLNDFIRGIKNNSHKQGE